VTHACDMDGCMNIVSNYHSFCYDHREPDCLARAVTRAEKAVVRAAVAFNHVRFSHPPLGEFMGYLHRFEDAVDHLLAARAAAKKKGK